MAEIAFFGSLSSHESKLTAEIERLQLRAGG